MGQARQLLAANLRDSDPLEVEDCDGFLLKAQDIKPEKVAKADLNVPIIVVRVGNSWFPIDGWHRIARQFNAESLDCRAYG